MSIGVTPRVRMERDGRVARVTVGSGQRRNALTSAAWAEIERTFRNLARDTALRGVILDGAHGMFCAGSDMNEWVDANPAEVELSFARMEAACTAVEELPVPVVALVRGAAAGAGCELALACDLRVVAEGASIGMPIARLGILVTPAFALRLAVLAGAATARDLLYTGRMVDAREAEQLGLATVCAPEDEVETITSDLLDAMLGQSSASVRAAKRAVNSVLAGPRAAAKTAAAGPPVDYDDFYRGINVFLTRGGLASA